MKFSTKIKKLLAAFDLKFLDPTEEQEYSQVKLKVIKDFALVSFHFIFFHSSILPSPINPFSLVCIPSPSTCDDPLFNPLL